MVNLSVGAHKSAMGTDDGRLLFVFGEWILLRSDVQGRAALCRRADDRGLQRAQRFSVDPSCCLACRFPFLVGLIALQFFNNAINHSLANWMVRSFDLKPVPSETSIHFAATATMWRLRA